MIPVPCVVVSNFSSQEYCYAKDRVGELQLEPEKHTKNTAQICNTQYLDMMVES